MEPLEEQLARLRTERDDKDAQLMQAAQIGQAVVEQNDAMRERLDELEAEKLEAEERAALAESEREEAEYSLEETLEQRLQLEEVLAQRDATEPQPTMEPTVSVDEMRAQIEAEVQGEMNSKVTELQEKLASTNVAKQREAAERKRMEQEADELRLMVQQEQDERIEVLKRLRAKTESEHKVQKENQKLRQHTVSSPGVVSPPRTMDAQLEVPKLVHAGSAQQTEPMSAERDDKTALPPAVLARRSNSVSQDPEQSEQRPVVPAEKNGYLVKKGGMRRNWLVRYFRLLEADVGPCQLVYYDKQGGKVLGNINVLESRASTAPRKHPHELELTAADRVYRIRAISDPDRDDWLAAIGAKIAQQQ